MVSFKVKPEPFGLGGESSLSGEKKLEKIEYFKRQTCKNDASINMRGIVSVK